MGGEFNESALAAGFSVYQYILTSLEESPM